MPSKLQSGQKGGTAQAPDLLLPARQVIARRRVMAVAVVGSVAFDSVTTPFGACDRELGGSGVHAALTAGRFTDVHLVAAVGDDFVPGHESLLRRQGVDTAAVEHVPGGTTLNWRVRYDLDLALPQPEHLELGVFDGWRPRLSPEAAEAKT